MGFPFRRPPGDPEAVRSGARKIGAASADAATATSGFSGGTSTALAEWNAPVAAQFAELAGAGRLRLSAVNTQLDGSADVLLGYADTLHAAQEAFDRLQADWEAHQSVLDGVRRVDEPTPSDDQRSAAASGAQARIEENMREALRELTQVEARVANAFDASTGTLVPDGGSMTPEQLYRQVTAAWAGIAPVFDVFQQAAKPVGGAVRLVRGGVNAVKAANAVRAWGAAQAASLLAAQVENLALAKADATARVIGDVDDMRVLRAWFTASEEIADAGYDAARLTDAAHDARSTFLNTAAASTKFARGLAVVGMGAGVYDLVANPGDETGVRRGVSMTLDVAGVAAGGYMLATGAGLIAVTPVGAAFVLGVGVAAGAWALGTYVYDHWDDITHGVDVATDWVADTATRGWNEATSAVSGAVDDLGEGLSDFGGAVADGIGGMFD